MNNITTITDADYRKYSIIKPPERKDIDLKNSVKTERLVIDSKFRDKTLFPNPNNYEIKFEDDINDVIKAKLIYFDGPMSNYLINQYFNSFVINTASTDYTITLNSGNYTESQLIAQIQTKLDAAIGTGIINSTYNANSDHFIFTSSQVFTLKFIGVEHSIHMILGFELKNYTSVNVSGTQTIEAVYRKNFNYNNYIIMNIDNFDLLKSINRDLNKSFAIICKQYQTLAVTDLPRYIKYFNPPIPRLVKLKVSFFDSYGNPYDFQGMDHRFELELDVFKQRRYYQDIFTK